MRYAILRCADALAAMLVAGVLLAAPIPANAQSDSDFVAAKSAFDRGDWRRLDALAPALSAHVLARYVEYWQLKSRLDDATPTPQVFLRVIRRTGGKRRASTG